MKNINIENIKNMSYIDFIGLINQTNVPPGSYNTLSRWVNFSGIDEGSSLLEIACTTGFSSREISTMTGCRAHGIDISEKSVKTALLNKEQLKNKDLISYESGDAYLIEEDKKYSHILVGAALGFFSDPEKMIEKITRLFGDRGFLLASPFYIKKEIPKDLLEKAEKVFGIMPTQISYKEVMAKYAGFEVLYEERMSDIYQETEEELHHYCKSTIDRFIQFNQINDIDLYNSLFLSANMVI